MLKNLVLVSIIAVPIAAENLLDIYNEALDNDPQSVSYTHLTLPTTPYV